MPITNPFSATATNAADDGEDHARAARGNRRRLLVFAAVFVPCLVVGMAWNLLRPAEYRAVAQLQVALPALGAVAEAPASAPESMFDTSADFVGQVQRLQSRPLLEQVQQRLAAAGRKIDADDGDPVARLQSMISAHPVPQSTVIELVAVGAPPTLLAAALNELIVVYGDELQHAYRNQGDQRLDQTRDELARLEQLAGQRRLQLERFRGSTGILSSERDENDSVARTRGLATALNNAVEKHAQAEAKLRARRDAMASGTSSTTAREDPTLANLEARASQLREELREIGRTYTEDFMAMDQRTRTMRERLAELEAQIAQRRVVSQDLALANAQEEAASTKATVERLQAQMNAQQQGLRNFSVGFARAKAMEDDLNAIERTRREAMERLARLEAGELARRPTLDVLQPATPPETPWRPDYSRDGAWVLAASFALGLLAMGFVELFNRPPRLASRSTTTVVLPPAWPHLANAGTSLRLPAQPTDTTPAALPAGTATDALPPPPPPELTQPEAAALLAAARGPARLACAGWLLGLETSELQALRHGDVDAAAGVLRVGGAWARELALPAWLVTELPPAAAAATPLLHDADGRPLPEADLQTLLICAAVDGGLPDATGITPQRLRNTAIGWLLRQGLRYTDLPARIGRLDASTVSGFAALAAATPKRTADEIEALMPALRMPPPA